MITSRLSTKLLRPNSPFTEFNKTTKMVYKNLGHVHEPSSELAPRQNRFDTNNKSPNYKRKNNNGELLDEMFLR